MPDHSQFKLGRKDNRPGLPKLPLLSEVLPNLPTPAQVGGYGVRETGWGMLGNDTYGDCYPAFMMHSITAMTRWSQAVPYVANTVQTLSLYSAITGFNPNEPTTDQGTEPGIAIDYWLNTGVDLGNGTHNKLAGAAGIRAGAWDDLVDALAWAGDCGISWSLPVSCQSQEVWDVVADDGGVWGGHETKGLFYNNDTGLVRFVSWGKELLATKAFVEKYMVGGVVPLNHDAIRGNGLDPMSINWTQLASVGQALRAAIG
jgi:hypothetical protein